MAAITKNGASRSPVLQGKNAVVFGAGGSIGAALAKEFAAEGAQVFLVGRTSSNVEEVAKQIADNGGTGQTAVLNTLNDVAVDEYINGIAKQTGRILLLCLPEHCSGGERLFEGNLPGTPDR